MRYYLALGSLLLMAACTTTPPANSDTTTTVPTAGPVSQEQAAGLATQYFRAQADSAEYLLPTLRVLDAGSNWQVLVKRRDRVGRMPDGSAIEIAKGTGRISPVRVK